MADTPQHSLAYRAILTLACLVILVAGMKAAQSILVPFLVAVFLAILGLPSLAWLLRKNVPNAVAALIVVFGMVGVLALLGALVGGSIDSFAAAAPRYQEKLTEYVDNLDPRIHRLLGLDDATSEGLAGDPASAGGITPRFKVTDYVNAGAVMTLVGATLVGVANALSNTILVILTMAFILLEAAALPQKIRIALGRPDADLSRFSKVTSEVQRYLAIKTWTSLATGILVGLWCAFLGVDFALLWGLVAFLLNYIPNLGSIIAAVPPILLALIQSGRIGLALMVAAGYLVVNFSIGNVIEPNLMGRRLGLSTLVVFLSLVFWGWVWGPVGMLLSVPLTMILKILLENSAEFHWIAVLLGSSGAAAQELNPPPKSHSQKMK